jgi:hypothetical protein
MKTTKLIWRKAEPDWANSDPHNSRSGGSALPAIWSQPGSLLPVTQDQNAEHWGPRTSRHKLKWYMQSNHTILSLPAHIAVYRAVNCVTTLYLTITHSIIADIHGWVRCSPSQVYGSGGRRLGLQVGWRFQPHEGNGCHISTSTKRKGMNSFHTKNSCTFTVIGLDSDFIPTVWLCKWSFLCKICVSIMETFTQTELQNKPTKHRYHCTKH